MNQFIVLDQINPGFSASISLHCCQFSTAEYSDSLFQQHHIHRPMELERAVVKRRAEFFAGRYCVKKSLGLLDGTIADVHIGKNRNPIWPNHIVGSISHSNSHAVAATALKSTIRGIGVDIQGEIGEGTRRKIESLIVFEDEYKNVFQGDDNLTAQETFTIAFSAKESFFKAAFSEVGRYFDFSCISIVKIDKKRQLISMKLNEYLSENLKPGVCVQADYRILPEKEIITLVRLD